MAKFEFVTHFNEDKQTIEAADYSMDTTAGKLTFFDAGNESIASFGIDKHAWVKRMGK